MIYFIQWIKYLYARLSKKILFRQIDAGFASELKTYIEILKSAPEKNKLKFPLPVNGDGDYVIEKFIYSCPHCGKPVGIFIGEIVNNSCDNVSFRIFWGCTSCRLCGAEHIYVKKGRHILRRNIDIHAFNQKFRRK